MENKIEYKKKLLDRLLKFAVRIIFLAGKLPKTPAGYAIANQIIRSGTSIGANCEEAQEAFSRKDFLKGIIISLKEAKETSYWLKVIKFSHLLSENFIEPELKECNEIVAILITSVKTTKNMPRNSQFSILNSHLGYGFTLLELLVVIAIIGILAVLSLPNLISTRQRARDAQRKSDLTQIQKALELYKQDQIAPTAYPATASFPAANSCWSSGASCTGNVYMNKVPGDPLSGSYTYTSPIGTDNYRYRLCSCLENLADPFPTPTFAANCNCGTKKPYGIIEP